MAITITATEAVRRFSELLNAIKYRHDSFTIIRGGKAAAMMAPVTSANAGKTLKELHGTVTGLPSLADDNEAFARDIAGALKVQPSVPEKPVWE